MQLLAAAEPSEELLGDKARGTVTGIPTKSNRVNRCPFDEQKYKTRDVIERSMDRIKGFRAIVT